MKRILFACLSVLCFTATQAQDIYKVEALAAEDLNGTARFVGMGGAMSALGADLSAMSTNPAAIGLYRNADASLSASVLVQPDARKFGGRNKVSGSFDQVGFVYSIENEGPLRFFNVGFNYHRRSNAKRYLSALGVDLMKYGDLTQAWQIADRAGFNPGNGEFTFLDLGSTDNTDRDYVTPQALLAYDTYLIDPKDDDGDGYSDRYIPRNYANSYDYQRADWGGVHEFDFNMSFNLNERIYGGVTFGVHSVNLNSYTDYSEWLIPSLDALNENRYSMIARELIHGSGFDVKAGVIVRPFEESAFRVGFSVSTPVFYNLTAESNLEMNTPRLDEEKQEMVFEYQDFNSGRYDYKVRTPWKINVSAATTVGNMLALGAEYELKTLGGSQVRYGYGDYYDETDIVQSEKDEALCDDISRFMKATHTLRVGAEVRADRAYVRAGYNFVSAPFKSEAYLNQFLMSESYYNQVNTDYVNLGETHRLTCGFGYRGKHFYGDVAYQYQTQSADVYAFHVPEGDTEINRLNKVSKSLERHNVLFTLGYKF